MLEPCYVTSAACYLTLFPPLRRVRTSLVRHVVSLFWRIVHRHCFRVARRLSTELSSCTLTCSGVPVLIFRLVYASGLQSRRCRLLKPAKKLVTDELETDTFFESCKTQSQQHALKIGSPAKDEC